MTGPNAKIQMVKSVNPGIILDRELYEVYKQFTETLY